MCRPHVVCKLMVADGLIQLWDGLGEDDGGDEGLETTLEYELVRC